MQIFSSFSFVNAETAKWFFGMCCTTGFRIINLPRGRQRSPIFESIAREGKLRFRVTRTIQACYTKSGIMPEKMYQNRIPNNPYIQWNLRIRAIRLAPDLTPTNYNKLSQNRAKRPVLKNV